MEEATPIYQQIASYVNRTIDEAWSLAWIGVNVLGEGGGDIFGRYKPEMAPADKVSSFATGVELYELFVALRQALQAPEEEPWTQAIFTIAASAKFNLELSYTPLEQPVWEWAKRVNKRKAQQTGL